VEAEIGRYLLVIRDQIAREGGTAGTALVPERRPSGEQHCAGVPGAMNSEAASPVGGDEDEPQPTTVGATSTATANSRNTPMPQTVS
jgi:hypothetical protein